LVAGVSTAACQSPISRLQCGTIGKVVVLILTEPTMDMATDKSATGIVTAAILVIGDEILSGRTKDKNIGYIAEYLTNIGVDLREVRVVPDIEEEIVAAVNALRARYTHVFTTGGIGPTHDDITADSIAKAFGVPIDVDERAVKLLLERIPQKDLNEARLRMARIPQGADLIENSVSKAPGFSLSNVHVMAGVPAIMQAMLDALAPRLQTGTKMLSRSIPAKAKEGDVATPLAEVQKRFPDIIMGSYPSYADGIPTTTLVLRSRDEARLVEAEAAVEAMLAEIWARVAS
jgi:molybdenum cofactor synthesis domain-containing protein